MARKLWESSERARAVTWAGTPEAAAIARPRERPGTPRVSSKVGRPLASSNPIAALAVPTSPSRCAATVRRWAVATTQQRRRASSSSSAAASAAPSSGSVPEPSSS